MIDRWVKLRNIQFKAIPSAYRVDAKYFSKFFCSRMYATSFDATVGIAGKVGDKQFLQNVHDGVVSYTVPVRKT